MRALRAWIARLGGLFGRRRRDEELSVEMESHLQMHIEDNLRAGMTPQEARRQALIKLGGMEQAKESYRERRGMPWLETLWQDIRYGLRMMGKSPGFTVIAILTLALGIGATTAVFSVVDRILFRSLPYPEADQLVTFGFIAPIEPLEFLPATDFVDWRAHNTAFAAMTTWNGIQDCDLTEAPPARLACVETDSNFLPTFGIQPLLGRNFSTAEDRPGAAKVALLFYDTWKNRFGGDPHIVGKVISLDGQPTTVLGVLPRDFELPNLSPADFLVPQGINQAGLSRDPKTPVAILRAFARLKPGVSIAQAKASLEPSFEESLKWMPAGFRSQISLSVRSLREREIGDAKTASWVLLAAVLAVLLIACANVANLLIARGSVRQREYAIRAALGGGRGRLLRQMLTENMLLAVAGGGLGCALAFALLHIFIAISPAGIPRLGQATIDSRVLIFTLGVSLASGILFGLASAQQTNPIEALHDRASSGISRRFLRRLLVSAQIATSFVLLTGAGLLLRSFVNLTNTPLGMDSASVVIATISLNQHLYSNPARQLSFFNSLEQQLPRLPGVNAFGLSDSLPPSGQSEATAYSSLEIAGRPRTPRGMGGMVAWSSVTPGYFAALGIPILEGRAFTEEDGAPDVHDMILNQSLAKRLFPGENPVGKSIRFSEQGPWETIIGVSGDVKYVQNDGAVRPADPAYYRARGRTPHDAWSYSSVLIRTTLAPAAVASWLRTEVASLDPTVPVEVTTMGQRVSKLESRPRFNAALLGLFALMGMVLAAIGTYGVLAFVVIQRTREIGIRMAVGAVPNQVLRLMLRQGLQLALAGVGIGLVISLALTRLIRTLLFGISVTDPLTFTSVALVLTAVAFAACYIPARRAVRVDPMVALRYE